MDKMGKDEIELIANIGLKILKKIEKTHGPVHKRARAEIDGVKGDLVWDFIVWNEITFDNDKGEIYSYFNSISDEETEKVWNELVGKYGV